MQKSSPGSQSASDSSQASVTPIINAGNNAQIVVNYGNSHVQLGSKNSIDAQTNSDSLKAETGTASDGEIKTKGTNGNRDEANGKTTNYVGAKNVTDSGLNIKQKLKKSYTGVWGAKVFWLAMLTILPVLVNFKIHYFHLRLSFATILYIVYHGIGWYIWAEVHQTIKLSDDDVGEWLKIYSFSRYHHVIGWAVSVLLVMTFFARVNLEFYGSHHLTLPEWIYEILGVHPEDKEISQREPIRINASLRPERSPSEPPNEMVTKPENQVSLARNKDTIDRLAFPLRDITGEVGFKSKIASLGKNTQRHSAARLVKGPTSPVYDRESGSLRTTSTDKSNVWVSSLWKIRTGNAEYREAREPEQCSRLSNVVVKQVLTGTSVDKASHVYELTVGNASASQILLTHLKLNWRYVRGQLTSAGGSGYPLQPVAKYVLTLSIDPESSEVGGLDQPIYPSLVLPPGTLEDPSLVTFQLQLHYEFTGNLQYHPNDWNIYFDLILTDNEKRCVLVFDHREWSE